MTRTTPAHRVAVASPVAKARLRMARREAGQERSRFAGFLAGKGLKLTRQRELVLREVFRDNGHFEADELVERMKQRDARVSRATVYRTLDLLQECMLVEKVNFGTSRSFYEHMQVGEHHDHMICTRCGTVIEFLDDRLEALQEEISRKHGMELTHHSMRLFGICKSCRQGRQDQ
jgi:Fur family ferric uptake transcriptional regulator